MTRDPLCRWAQPLDGRRAGECDRPAARGRSFCEEHGDRLSRAVAGPRLKRPGERPIRTSTPAAPVVTRHVAPSRPRSSTPGELADRIVTYVNGADAHPITRTALCEHFNRSPRTIQRAVSLALKDARIRVERYGKGDRRGYYPTTDDPNLKVAV